MYFMWPQDVAEGEEIIMTDLKIGQLITTPQQRDAIHVAVVPVIAMARLKPGQEIGVKENYKAQYESRIGNIGIVDPFLKQEVRMGQSFWMFLTPGSITSLRHDWTHPAFGAKEPSFSWMERFASQTYMTGSELIEAVTEAIDGNGSVYVGDYDDGIPEEFWDHYQILTGRYVAKDDRPYFRCAC